MLKIATKVILDGRSVVDDVALARFLVQIDSADPTNMVFSSRPIDADAYKNNIDVVRADEAEFRAYAYSVQDDMIKSID